MIPGPPPVRHGQSPLALVPDPLSTAPSAVPARRSSVVRAVFAVAGTVCLAVAALGLILPILPSTPFLLVAAACYARASSRLHTWLLENRTFGPTIRAWQQSRSIPRRAKWTAIPLMMLTIGTSAVFFVEELLIRAAVLGVGLVLGVFLYRIPESD